MILPNALGFDEGTIEYYTTGACHILALALHELLGCPIRVLKGWQGDEIVVHITCSDPADPTLVLDIRGRRPEESVPAEWPDVAEFWWEDAWPADIAELIEQDQIYGYTAENLEEARVVAGRIIDRYRPDWKSEILSS